MLRTTITLIFFLLLSILSSAQNSVIGFSNESAAEQLKLESVFEKNLNATNLDNWMQRLAAEPHWVGTKFGEDNAKWIQKQFKSWGYDAKIETYDILFPYPTERVLELLGPTPYKAKLTAVPVEGDPFTAQGDALLPSYNAFSIDGDVTADLVFVNYGIPKDYEELEKLGISVKGKIVIAKYQGSWRGIKPKLAAENGAIGCIIYSDPQDDGYGQGDVYPKGAYKNKTGVQRGSVMDMPTYPGDVLTPGYGATKDAKRLDRKDAPTITKIPVLPISYEDAQPLLEALEGPVAPASWRGGLPITYHIGPGPAKVRLKLAFDWKLVPAHNVIATMKGTDFPDQWVMRGNHHDAWVHGANDPISGMVALMEEARAVGELAKNGQKPKRTLVYCAWDAEEPGLIGSTEWVEDHKKELQTGVSVKERRIATQMVNGGDDAFNLYALGSGSDYTPFIQHAGIASLNLGFGGENGGGEYHTIYDTYPHYKRFKDPDFAYGVALANTAGRITLRLANADVLPFDFKEWHTTVSGYWEEIKTNADQMRIAVEKHNKLLKSNAFVLASDPQKEFNAPEAMKEVPYLNFAPVQNGLAALNSTIEKLSLTNSLEVSKAKRAELNQRLIGAERMLTSEKGLPRRPWFKHQIYAPGFYTGYGVKTLPGVREAIEQKDWKEAQEQITVLSNTLKEFNNFLIELNTLAK